MSDPTLFVDLFAEDYAHEVLLVPLLERVARDEGVHAVVRVRSARGGHGRAVEEFRLYQKLAEKNAMPPPAPDLVVVAIDGNCTTFARKRQEIREAATELFLEKLVSACPDPHVERWYLGDPDSFHQIVGYRPAVGRKKCTRGHYKDLLARAVQQAGHPSTLGGIEFAREIANSMDLYRAGRNDSSLKAFLDDLRYALRSRRQCRRGVDP